AYGAHGPSLPGRRGVRRTLSRRSRSVRPPRSEPYPGRPEPDSVIHKPARKGGGSLLGQSLWGDVRHIPAQYLVPDRVLDGGGHCRDAATDTAPDRHAHAEADPAGGRRGEPERRDPPVYPYPRP